MNSGNEIISIVPTKEGDPQIPGHATYTKDGFLINDKGVFFVETDKNGQEKERVFICSKLFIKASVRDEAGKNHGLMLEFRDRHGKLHTPIMPLEMLAGDGLELRKLLFNHGLDVSTQRGARNLLMEYIRRARPKGKILTVSCLGWNQGVYLFPGEVIEKGDEKIVLQGEMAVAEKSGQAGSLQKWKENVSVLARDNSRLVLAISIAFAPPLLKILGEESGGFHFRGGSSIGKTTCSYVANSVWGEHGRLQRWRATTNGLEAVALRYNDSFLGLDEIGQANSRDIGEAAYMLANGAGKARANRDGSARPLSEWRLYFLSTGEKSLADHLRQSGQKVKAGQEIRVIDIPADAGMGFGILEKIHHFQSSEEMVRHLVAASGKYYGAAARHYISQLSSNLEAWVETVRHHMDTFKLCEVPPDVDGQVKRVGTRFALVAAAGELATEMGITGWEKGESQRAAARCMKDWVECRGGVGAGEIRHTLEQVRLFFEQHGESRFTPIDGACDAFRTSNRAGYRRVRNSNTEYLVFPAVFKTEVCKDLDPKFVSKLLVERGWIVPDSQGKATSTHRVSGEEKPMRFYLFKNVLAE